ncbi:hypothetical protein [Euzebya sp.]|uniref:hypothetical protein n=1 Tax=Euzebya sp. TaxID=1971409 RepID=UPI0035168BD9
MVVVLLVALGAGLVSVALAWRTQSERVTDVRGELAGMQAELAEVRDALDRTSEERDDLTDALDSVEAEFDDVNADRAAAAAAAAAAEERVNSLASELETVRAELADVTAALEDAEQQLAIRAAAPPPQTWTLCDNSGYNCREVTEDPRWRPDVICEEGACFELY